MSRPALEHAALPHAAPARVLALGAFLKNRACLVMGDEVVWSPLHGDLGTAAACAALAESAAALLAIAEHRCGPAPGAAPVDAIAHDLHPDFFSTRLALETAARLGVPALAVQHHHAHLAVVQAEQGGHGAGQGPWVGLALDGVGLGTDGTAWGGEVLCLRGAECTRVGHLPALALPGGDVAAREPWRLVAAVLHAAGRAAQIDPQLAPRVGTALAGGVATMLARDLNCPSTTSAGRWFDAAAGALGISTRQAEEAEAAQALEAEASAWMQSIGPARAAALRDATPGTLDLVPLVASLLAEAGSADDRGRGAARFHLALAGGLVAAVASAAAAAGTRDVALGGGCFFNRLLSGEIERGLLARGLRPFRPGRVSVGDAGLALGQAWAAGLRLRATHERTTAPEPAHAEEN
ncbi:MAG: carbamoyltransferase HypF [Rubrivivax sp.]|nr:carbamoyltransferase HypF [Rubrivivax sp.]